MALSRNSHNGQHDLRALVQAAPGESIRVDGLALDSRAVKAGDGFVAIAGQSVHGLDHVSAAEAAGAVAIVVDQTDEQRALDSGTDLPCLAVPALREKLPGMARAVFGDVDEQAVLCGVTGTDGKTSTSLFLAQLLHSEDSPCGVLGTIGNGLLGGLEASTHTTADVFSTYRALGQFAETGARHIAMEVSSHALDQARVGGLQFAVGALTNVGRDHLDYHGSVAEYAAAKRKLFTEHARRVVFNLDDATGRDWFEAHTNPVGFSLDGREGARWRGDVLDMRADGIRCRIEVGGEFECECTLPVLGRFNLSNVLCACAMAEAVGFDVPSIFTRLERIKPVVGRLECLRADGHPTVVIDYAHTEQALCSAITALREHVPGELWCVFGCGGDRDSGKRAGMARAACAADRVVLTSDNPRTESPEAIARDAAKGFVEGVATETILDRREAIEHALTQARPSDCVLIAGKGHEPYQEIAGKRIAFSDHAVVRGVFGCAS